MSSLPTSHMENNTIQKVTFSNSNWSITSKDQFQKTLSACSLTEPGLLDETIEVVKEKVWSLRNAWRGVADALSKVGVSPTVFGYSSIPLHDDEYVKEHREDILALAKVDADGGKPPSKGSLLKDSTVCEEDNLLDEKDDHEEDVDHAFMELSGKESERRSLTSAAD